MTDTTATPNPTEMTPAEIDARLADLWTAEDRARQTLEFYSRQATRRTGEPSAWDARAIAKAEADLLAARTEAEPYEAEFKARGGWLRYFLVNNSGGHVHRGMGCSTCYPSTQYQWLTDLADCDEAAMVAEYGEMACTVCFPAAPTMRGFGDGTSTLARYSAEAKAERANAKAERAAKKAAKALDPEDVEGGFTYAERIGDREFTRTISTIHAAKAWLTDAAERDAWGQGEHPAYPHDVRDALADVLAARLGTTAADELAAAAKRAAKRR